MAAIPSRREVLTLLGAATAGVALAACATPRPPGADYGVPTGNDLEDVLLGRLQDRTPEDALTAIAGVIGNRYKSETGATYLPPVRLIDSAEFTKKLNETLLTYKFLDEGETLNESVNLMPIISTPGGEVFVNADSDVFKDGRFPKEKIACRTLNYLFASECTETQGIYKDLETPLEPFSGTSFTADAIRGLSMFGRVGDRRAVLRGFNDGLRAHIATKVIEDIGSLVPDGAQSEVTKNLGELVGYVLKSLEITTPEAMRYVISNDPDGFMTLLQKKLRYKTTPDGNDRAQLLWLIPDAYKTGNVTWEVAFQTTNMLLNSQDLQKGNNSLGQKNADGISLSEAIGIPHISAQQTPAERLANSLMRVDTDTAPPAPVLSRRRLLFGRS